MAAAAARARLAKDKGRPASKRQKSENSRVGLVDDPQLSDVLSNLDSESDEAARMDVRRFLKGLEDMNAKLERMPNHTAAIQGVQTSLDNVVESVQAIGDKASSDTDSEKFRQMSSILSTMASLVSVLEPDNSAAGSGHQQGVVQTPSPVQRMCNAQYHNICNMVENIFKWTPEEQIKLYSSMNSIEYFQNKLKASVTNPDK